MAQVEDTPGSLSAGSKSSLSAKSPRHGKHLVVQQNSIPLPSSGDEGSGLELTSDTSASYNSDFEPKHRKKRRKSPAEGAYAALSKQERREFRMAFRLFDKDDDGQISVMELKLVFEGLNYHFTQQQLVDMLKAIDDNGDGKVDIDEFVSVMKGAAYSDLANNRPYVEELREAFEVFDKDGDGQISPQELASIMQALGEDLNEQDILVMIREADSDGDGNIDFDEFKKLMESDTILGYDNMEDVKYKPGSSQSGSESHKASDQ